MDIQSVKIRKADFSDIPTLKNIWKICFGDEDTYIDFFFEERFSTLTGLVFEFGNEIAGGMYLMKCSLSSDGIKKDGFYGYAIGILPQYRGKGIYAFVQRKLIDYFSGCNLFFILSPANEKLIHFYKSLGLKACSFVSSKEYFPKDLITDINTSELDAPDFERLRNKCFNDNYIIWDKTALDYVLKENKHTGGVNLYFKDNEKEYFVIASFDDDSVIVKESNLNDEMLQKLTNHLCNKYQKGILKAIVPCKPSPNCKTYGLGYNLDNGIYLNHILN